uniref:Uncharacterized protein n=1 Tax=Vitis vinifera TaxID=29760 RepID=F6HI14_VITVI
MAMNQFATQLKLLKNGVGDGARSGAVWIKSLG